MYMKSIEIAKKLEGINTLKMVIKKLKIRKSTAIKTLSILRKDGFVQTSGGGKQPRFYKISPIRVAGQEHMGVYDIVNKYSRVKLVEPVKHKLMDRRLSIEEAIPMAIKEGSFRLVLASLGLFNFVKEWSKLYYYSKKYNAMRKVGALYDVAKLCIRTRRMDKRTRKALLKGKEMDLFVVKPLKSQDFKDIEKKWRIYIPFNKSDLERYKE